MNFISNQANSFQSQVKPLEAVIAVGDKPVWKEPRLVGDWVIWLEQRPLEGGRTTALIKPWFKPNCIPQELTPAPINIRSRVHGYGGGALSVEHTSNEVLLIWIDDCDGCLWSQTWEILEEPQDQSKYLKQFNKPFCLSKKANYLLADGQIDKRRKRWIGIMEDHEKDYLVQFSLNQESADPLIIYQPKDFLGYLALSPDGNALAWVEWQSPSMPWDASQLWLALLDDLGKFSNTFLLAGQNFQEQKSISVFQPVWLPNGEIVVSEDANGWSNLMISETPQKIDEFNYWKRLWPMNAEVSMPQWVYGMSTISAAGNKIAALICEEGTWQISLLTKDGFVQSLDQPFNDLQGIDAQGERLVSIASNSFNESGLLEFNLNNSNWEFSLAREPLMVQEQISKAISFWFEGFQGMQTHAWYYPPVKSDKKLAPLLVTSHSGPTSMASLGLDLEIQFWTSRGWGVVDVNYGGSTGFGRSYRQRLKNGWGKVDVFDCAAAAKALISAGKTDKNLVAIQGGSAGGFTTLASLCFTDVFRVGACSYPVCDLISMSKSTHRFEKNYLEHLVGPLPEYKNLYHERSPYQHVNNIKCPVIFFHGLKDKVVPIDQTNQIVDALKNNDIPVELHTYKNEGHGFRDGKVKISVLELTERFFKKYLDL
tara:strand:- start:50501 stop:52459 length:1959 start_codon:yes stop_codon:yes gene_type:complete